MKVKIKVIQRYDDLKLGRIIEKGETLEVEENRSKQLIIAKVAEKYDDENLSLYGQTDGERNGKVR